ncbi:MAG: hypothetical protein Q8Q06_02675 [bacterium]|nr:hypothetical protein [bacterium]
MIDKRFFLAALAVGGFGGIVFANFIFPMLASRNVLGLGNLYGFIKPDTIITKIEKETIIVPESDYFGGALKDINSRIVYLQSFSKNKILRFGSGIVMTQDGIVATLNSIVPAGADSYQVWVNGKPQKANIIFRSRTSNFALVRVDNSGLSVASLADKLPDLASSLLLVGKSINLNEDSLIIEPAFVTQINKTGFLFKANFNESLFGSALINKSGQVLGIVDFKNKQPSLISHDIIKQNLEIYLEGSNK